MLTAKILNEGVTDAVFDVSFRIDGSEHALLDGNHLAPGGTLRLEASWPTMPGGHEFEVWVDPTDAVEEEDEGNNRLEHFFEVPHDDTTSTAPEESWYECRDGREWKVQIHADGTRSDEDVGPCDQEASWIVNQWCDDSGQWQVEYEHSDGRREVRTEGACHDGSPGEPTYEDPYGCDAEAGEWWDHYMARCVSEEEWQLQDGFFRCTEQAHRSFAEAQKSRDILERENRQERRALEEKARDLERQGRYDEARDAWDELQRLDWEDQRRFHDVERQIADAVNGCVDEFSDQARAHGWDHLVEEFEMQRFHAAAPQSPRAGPEGRPACPPSGRQDRSGQAYPDHHDRQDRPYDGDHHEDEGRFDLTRPDSAPRGGDPCGPPGGAHEVDFGLPPEAVEAMEAARAWCEERRWDVESRMFEAESYEDAQEAEQELRDVEQECRKRMESIFREFDRGYENDFDRQFGSFSMTETNTGIDVRGANTWFIGLPDQMRMTDFTCQGASTLALVQPYFDIEDVRPTAQHKLGFFAGSDRPFLVVHDDPRCTVGIKPGNAHVDDAEIKVRLSSLYHCEDDGHIVCTDADGNALSIIAHGEPPVLVDERTLLVRHALDMRLGSSGDDQSLDPYLENDDFDGSAAVTMRDGEVVAQTVTLGDMEMTISEGDQDQSLKVSLSKASHVGSFVVLALDAGLFADCRVEVQGWDVTDGDREALELRPAANLPDALDASFEGDHVKYYAVEDAEGCQLILTNGHYSEKEFTLQAAKAQEVGDDNSVPGMEIGLVAVGLLGAVSVLRLRRRS